MSVDGQALPIHERKQYGQTVVGSVQAAVGEEFEIAVLDARTEGKVSGYEVTLYFGKEYISGTYNKPSHVKDRRSLPAEHDFRYIRYKEVRVGESHVRRFRFSKVATTDEEEGACSDADFLSYLSVIKLEYRRIKQAPRVQKNEYEKAMAKELAKIERARKKNRPVHDPAAKKDARMLSERADKANFAIDPSFGDLVYNKPEKRKGGGGSWKYVYVDQDQVDLTFKFNIRSAAYIQKLYTEPAPAVKAEPERASTPPIRLGKTLLIDFDDDEVEAAAAAAGVRVGEPEEDDEAALMKEEDDSDDEGSDEESPAEEDEDDFTPPPAKKRRTSDKTRVKQEQLHAGGGDDASGSGFGGSSTKKEMNPRRGSEQEDELLAVKDEPPA
ncbi:hypothetical protein JCM11251_005596 [Rhodosporidiobolus azoricus]